MEQRAGGGHRDLSGQAGERSEQPERGDQVVDPDTATVDDPGHQEAVAESAKLAEAFDVGPSPGEVEPDPLDRQVGDDGQRRAGVAEGGGDQQARAAAGGGETPIGGAQGGEVVGEAILDEGALVELHPFGALGGEPLDEVDVDLEERVEQGERVESRTRRRAGPGAGR